MGARCSSSELNTTNSSIHEFSLSVQDGDNRCGNWTVWQTMIMLKHILQGNKPTCERIYQAMDSCGLSFGFFEKDPILTTSALCDSPSAFIRQDLFRYHQSVAQESMIAAEDKVKISYIDVRIKIIAKRLLQLETQALALNEIFALKIVGIDFTSAFNQKCINRFYHNAIFAKGRKARPCVFTKR